MKCSISASTSLSDDMTESFAYGLGVEGDDGDIVEKIIVDIEFVHAPEILTFFSRLGEVHDISKITKDGVYFFVTDIPLWIRSEAGEMNVRTENSDGHVFVPMSNVVCINGIGNIVKG